MRLFAVVALAGLLAGPAWADSSVDREPGTITTRATARARLPNTVADVSIGVEAHAPSISATQAALAAGTNTLLAYLRQHSVERLRMEQVSITPHTGAEKGQPERIVGYDGNALASFRVTAERLSAVVSGALANGGNDLARTALAPRESEVDAERARLAAEAAEIALSQAHSVAEATGRRLGAIKRIEVEPSNAYRGTVPPTPLMRVAAMPAAAQIATEAGDAEMTASVTVTVNLVEP